MGTHPMIVYERLPRVPFHYQSVLTMNSFVPIKKFIKVVSTHRIPKRERHSSLQECLESSKESRRRRCRWKPWIMLFLFSLVFYYLYTHKDHLFPEISARLDENAVPYSKISEVATSPPLVNIDTVENTNHISLENNAETLPKNESVTVDGIIEIYHNTKKLPFCILKKPYGKVMINKTSINISANNVHPRVKRGGYYRPLDCMPKHRVGIIVPYRNREHNLGIFLYNIHPFLMQQKLEYQIFVIEQEGTDLFNKGRLLNAGFREIVKFNSFQCVILHDLDLLPMNAHILYTCPTLPRHMCATVNDTDIRRDYNQTYDFKSLFGGVTSMTMEQYERANGYSNQYFGWGGEDNDMFWRLRAVGYPIVRYNKAVGMYTVLPHKREPANPFRHHLLSRAMDRYKTDGLSDFEYYVISTKFYHLFTHIVVDINPRRDNITKIIHQWANTVYKFK